MIDYGQGVGGGYGGNDFSAQPRLVNGIKFKDPYGRNVEEYYPQNIMMDRRVARGSTYAAMVIPAGTNPDAMVMDRRNEDRKRRQFKRPGAINTKAKQIYPNRDIPTPDPVPGRLHAEVQTKQYVEKLTDKPEQVNKGNATEFYLDRPPVPLFMPKMPSKDCCKATQIFEGDWELFDFDAEVEPMLNVLCSKTLEQARMEVLEEEELRIMKQQKQEYEEIRNAELIEAHRLEAAELRCKQEVSRRKIQQQARKEERKAAHQKHVARVLAKKHLVGLRENAINALKDQGILVEPLQKVMNEDVLPWMLDKIDEFIKDDADIQTNAQTIVFLGVDNGVEAHSKTLTDRRNAKLKAIQEAEDFKKSEEQRRQKRRHDRLIREKEKIKEEFRKEIQKQIIDRGDFKSRALEADLHDVHGDYQGKAAYVGSLGGQLMQIFFTLETIKGIYTDGLDEYNARLSENPKDEYLLKPNNPAEVLISSHLRNFFHQYLRDMKNDQLYLVLHGDVALWLENNLTHVNDLYKLTDEQKDELRKIFVSKRGHLAHDVTEPLMEELLGFIFDIVTKKQIEGLPIKTDQVYSKIKLVLVPKDTVPDYELSFGENGKNNGEKSFVRVRIPLKNSSEVQQDEQVVEHFCEDGNVEVEQDEKCIAIKNKDGTLLHSNQAAARYYRHDVLNQIKKLCPEFFENNTTDLQTIQVEADRAYNTLEEEFISRNCSRFDMPMFDFQINAIDYE